MVCDEKIKKAVCSCYTKIKLPIVSEIKFDKKMMIYCISRCPGFWPKSRTMKYEKNKVNLKFNKNNLKKNNI